MVSSREFIQGSHKLLKLYLVPSSKTKHKIQNRRGKRIHAYFEQHSSRNLTGDKGNRRELSAERRLNKSSSGFAEVYGEESDWEERVDQLLRRIKMKEDTKELLKYMWRKNIGKWVISLLIASIIYFSLYFTIFKEAWK